MPEKFTFAATPTHSEGDAFAFQNEPHRRDDHFFDINDLAAIQVGLASPDTIRSWSKGEVLKAETINYRTQKPEATGLFCEKIFGPIKDYECHCGKYKKIRYQGITCEKCGVEVISKEWRRERMGHIELVAPCSHIWYLKSIPSRMSLVLEIPPKQLEDVIYYAAHICLDPGESKILQKKDFLSEANARIKFADVIREEIMPMLNPDSSEYIQAEQIIEKLGNEKETFDYFTCKSFIAYYLHSEFGDGASAIKRLLQEVDLDEEFVKITDELRDAKEARRVKLAKRLEVIDAFRRSGQKPEWMVLDVVPVIPPDLRPMLFLDGGRPAASDLNELYRRVIYRNIALRRLIEMSAPELMLTNGKRMLQEAVDALFENGRRTKPVNGPNGRPLKSLSSGLRGKQGRFRQNLLGKRVDYSGRSVIAVGPDLKMYQCGIPREMAIQLLRPFIVAELIKSQLATTLSAADKIINRYDPVVFDIVERIIGDHPVLLNRAPTLHRLSIQAFQPKLVDGRAIRLHPLVCPGFNADFDGDQMAVHVPLGKAAQEEAVNLMLASNNILTPRDGKALVVPSQDMILGNFHLTTEESYSDFLDRAEELEALAALDRLTGVNEKDIADSLLMAEDNRRYAANDAKVFSNIEEVILAYQQKEVSLHNRIAIRAKSLHKIPGRGIPADIENRYLITSVGKIIFNDVFPDDFRYINDDPTIAVDTKEMDSWFVTAEQVAEAYDENAFGTPMFQYINGKKTDEKGHHFEGGLPLKKAIGKKQLGPLIDILFAEYGTTKTSAVLDKIKDQGFRYSMISSVTVAISDIRDVEGKAAAVAEGQAKVDRVNEAARLGFLTREERHRAVVDVWKDTTKKVEDMVRETMKASKRNPLIIMANSGSRGSVSNFKQLIGMKGLVMNPKNEEIELPIVSSYLEGMKVSEFFINTPGARKGSADTALKTADSGYLTRRLVDVAQDVIVREEDCHCDHGFVVRKIVDTARKNETIRTLAERIVGRYSMHDILDPRDGSVIVPGNTLINEQDAKRIDEAGITEVEIRTIFTCQSKDGVCVRCYGLNMADRQPVKIGEAVGIMAAQSIGEPGTQLTMRVFHTGGMAESDITQGLPRVQELVEARHPKGRQALISEIPGTVTDITLDGDRHRITITHELPDQPAEVKEYLTDYGANPRVKVGDVVEAGGKLTDGSVDLKELLQVAGVEKLEVYMVKEIQKVYKAQEIAISDKHLEIIITQMLRKVFIIDGGDTDMLPGQRVSLRHFTESNGRALMSGKRPAVCSPLVLGITKAALETDSFLSAASFQETTRVLTDAAIKA
ncbi:MAG: DNA-directed RNA polymerase subunit beta', partial [Candidatus Enteromonas sp.]|nr:DNA-directed RNA polymerase subunit beta' [Candidatus Enteromonas sp.]